MAASEARASTAPQARLSVHDTGKVIIAVEMGGLNTYLTYPVRGCTEKGCCGDNRGRRGQQCRFRGELARAKAHEPFDW